MADDKKFTEDAYEQTLIALFRDELGYAYECGYEVERDYREPFYRADLLVSMRRLNPSLPADAMEQGIKQITNISIGTLEQNNEQFTLWMQNGLEVGYLQDGEERTALMRLIDYERPERNLFKVVNQWRVEEYKNKRCDMVVMVNGLPLVVVELKSAVSEDATIDDAYKQIKNYQQSVPSLFSYNAFNVISDMSETRAGTITAKEARYMEWKTVDGSYESTLIADYRTFFLGMFQQRRLLDILQNYICFDKNQGRYAKILTAYHQYYAVGKALERTKEAVEGNGKIGVFWHTQGSGKSLSMVFYAHQLVQRLPEVTIVVVTDRKDLDNQLFSQFCRCKDFLRQEPVNAQSRNDLGSLLQGRQSGGIIFTTIQKFEEGDTPLSPRRNIIVMSDEAHRSQYGDEHWDAQSQRMKKGFSQKMREALPGASFIGFTGTPISDRDRDTEEVFGHYIDIYDMSQAVDDGATRPVYYESRVVNLRQIEFSLFDEAFLQEVKNMKERNLAVELLTKLLKERIRQQQKTNITQSDLFSDMLSRSLSNYLKGLLTNEEVIQELLKMAQQMKHAEDEGNDLGLTSEEKAFYDALSTPEGVRQAYSDEEFVALTKELTEVLHTNRTIDWNRKESARAKMRVLVKRLLKKYKYPPEGAKKALETVMRQCDHWADDDENVL